MAKITLDNITTGYESLQKTNSNYDLLEAAIENTLSRDGTAPNFMQDDFDMNSNRILNLPAPSANTEPVRLGDIASLLGVTVSALTNLATIVDSIAGLKSYVPTVLQVGYLVYVRGYYSASDGGEGFFRLTNSSPGADNGGTFIHSSTSGYYYVRVTNGGAYNVQWFGAKGDNSTNDRAACQAAVDAKKAAGGGGVFFPEGSYILTGTTGADATKNGLLLPYTHVSNLTNRMFIFGEGNSSVLKAGTTGQYVIRLSDSYCGIHNLSIDGASLATVTGLGIVPEDTTQTTTLVYQMWNNISNVNIRNCVTGERMACGPEVTGTDSGCWYNNHYNVTYYSNLTNLLLDNGTNAGSSGVNRNNWFGGRIGQAGSNVGLWIKAGSTNNFHSVHFEGVATGVSPKGTPTGLVIDPAGTYAGDNNSNRFFGCDFEGNTRHIENINGYTEFSGCGFDASACLFTAAPKYIFGGGGASSTPQVYGPLVYQASALLSGYDYAAVVATIPINFKQGFYGTRQAVGGAAATGRNMDFGSETNTTAAGGGTTSQSYIFSAFDKAATYLCVSKGTSTSDSTHNATRVSLFVEHVSGTFTEYNLSDTKNTIVTHTISLSRSSVTISVTSNITGGIGVETVATTLNLMRIS